MAIRPTLWPTLGWLLQQTPKRGCLLIFNSNHVSWRSRASETRKRFGIDLMVQEIHRDQDSPIYSDLYITYNEQRFHVKHTIRPGRHGQAFPSDAPRSRATRASRNNSAPGRA